MDRATDDDSNGYEAVASVFIAGRGTRTRAGDAIGAAVVKSWASALPLCLAPVIPSQVPHSPARN